MNDVRCDHSYACGCFMKVHVCPRHLDVARRELLDLTSQIELSILDTKVSVSETGETGRLNQDDLPF